MNDMGRKQGGGDVGFCSLNDDSVISKQRQKKKR